MKKKLVGCKKVLKKETDMESNVRTYKAQVVAKDFIQKHGIDNNKTFLLVVMLKSI